MATNALSLLIPASSQEWTFGRVISLEPRRCYDRRSAGLRAHFFRSAGQFVNKVMVVVLARSPVSTAKCWPSALTSYYGKVRSGRLGKSS